MTTLHRIALLGFGAFERSTLASYFRLASTRDPRYEQVMAIPEADFLVADADDEPSVKLVLAVERLPETIFIGGRAPVGAIAWLPRPIDPLRVLRELDRLAARRMSQPPQARAESSADAQRRRTVIQPVRPQRPAPAAELLGEAPGALDLTLPDLGTPQIRVPVPAAMQPAAAAAASAARPMPLAPVPPVSASAMAEATVARARAAASMSSLAARGGLTRPTGALLAGTVSTTPSTALLVDDSEVALRFLRKKLAPFGLVTECASHSEAAIRRMAERRFDFVFLDMELGERSTLDGLGLCQRIKRDTAAANVVMVTAHHSELDRLRGALAGCDGFLGKPLDEDELALYLGRFGVRPAANAGRVPS